MIYDISYIHIIFIYNFHILFLNFVVNNEFVIICNIEKLSEDMYF